MYFESVSAVIAMDGHGGFVWAAYAVTAIVLVALVVMPLRRRRRELVSIGESLRREQAAMREEGS